MRRVLRSVGHSSWARAAILGCALLLAGIALIRLTPLGIGDASRSRLAPTNAGGADLVVDSLHVWPEHPALNQPVVVMVQVRNQGAAAGPSAYLDLYLDHTPAGCGDTASVKFWEVGPLAPGGQRDFRFTLPAMAVAGAHTLAAVVNSFCDAPESSTGNNGHGPLAFEVTDHLAPQAPAVLVPAEGTTLEEGQKVRLAWSDIGGEEYFIQVSGGPEGTTLFTTRRDPEVEFGPLAAGYTYSWRVAARVNGAETSWSADGQFKVRLLAPTALAGEALSCNQVRLTWSGRSAFQEGYHIYRNGAYVGRAPAREQFFLDTLAGEREIQTYEVRAYRGSLESAPGAPVDVQVPPCPVTKPDLTVDGLAFSPASPAVGEPVTFTVRIKNTGPGPASTGFLINLYLDRAPAGCLDWSQVYWRAEGLEPGAVLEFTFRHPGFDTASEHKAYAQVDSGCNIDERDKGNNLGGPVSVTVRPLAADLAVERITYTPAAPTAGQPITFTVSIANRGRDRSPGGLYMNFYIDHRPAGCRDWSQTFWPVDALEPGAPRDYVFTYPGFSGPGSHDLFAFVDSGCSLNESARDNNLLGPVPLSIRPATPAP